jgi:hypothetical protein
MKFNAKAARYMSSKIKTHWYCTWLTFIGAAACFVVLHSLSAQELPSAPKGFAWKQLEEVKTLLLVPDGWHVKEVDEKGTRAIFVTPEKFDKKYDVGLSVNVVRKLKGKSAPALAETTIAKLGKDNKLVKSWKTGAGKLKGFGCLVRAEAPDKSGPLMMHCLAFGNTETNTFHLFIFEAPVDQWDDAWKTGELIMKKLGIDDEI